MRTRRRILTTAIIALTLLPTGSASAQEAPVPTTAPATGWIATSPLNIAKGGVMHQTVEGRRVFADRDRFDWKRLPGGRALEAYAVDNATMSADGTMAPLDTTTSTVPADTVPTTRGIVTTTTPGTGQPSHGDGSNTTLTGAGSVPTGTDFLGGILPSPGSVEDMRARYASLATALVGVTASRSGISVGQIAATDSAEFSKMLGGDLSMLGNFGAAGSVADLNSLLAASPLAANWSTLEAAAQDIVSRSGTTDGAVAAAGTRYATEMGALRIPQLQMPSMPEMDTSWTTVAPPEGLMFGLLTNKSLTAMATDNPNMFDNLSANFSPEAQAQWANAMRTGAAAVGQQLGAGLPDPCGAALLAAAGTRSASAAQAAVPGGSGCTPCIASGVALGNQLAGMFDPVNGGLLTKPNDNQLTLKEWEGLSPAQQKAMQAANPGLKDLVAKMQQTAPTRTASLSSPTCQASQQATRASLTGLLPATLSNLGG